ncbi:hypothetical protein LSH36_1112g00067 [Paralvinella palmiformis]|uniref:ABC transporter domain-containing protein n=1 Tax=Paralvinella palmiformis TaxID=53620 RepID=A0AAD9IVI3_9ANNE|nr:hypothetical protein LSH36_1112g00067 [Paralvinella palmiformis]
MEDDEQTLLREDNTDTTLSKLSKFRRYQALLRKDVQVEDKNIKQEPMDLCWEHIQATATIEEREGQFWCLHKKEVTKEILNDVSGMAKAESFLAILGPSGSGKTTLLNCLTKRNLGLLKVKGRILVNGKHTGEDICDISSYVQQDDLFIGLLTVREHLWFNAILRLDRDLQDYEIIQRVSDVIKEMGLRKCENTTIGEPGLAKSLSGGERKRLAFATELLVKPTIMLCDEPTSGLDSFMARSVVGALKDMANKGHTIVATIHQPSSDVFDMFNDILIMKEGRTVFLGPKQDAMKFFSELSYECPRHYNPADYFMDVLHDTPGQEICDSFDESKYSNEIKYGVDAQEDVLDNKSIGEMKGLDKRTKRKEKAGWWLQMKMCFWRSQIEFMRNTHLFLGRILAILALCLPVAGIYWRQPYTTTGADNINGALFMMLLSVSYSVAVPSIVGTSVGFPLFLKECHDGQYSTSAYYFGGLCAELPFVAFAVLLGTSCSYWMIDCEYYDDDKDTDRNSTNLEDESPFCYRNGLDVIAYFGFSTDRVGFGFGVIVAILITLELLGSLAFHLNIKRAK